MNDYLNLITYKARYIKKIFETPFKDISDGSYNSDHFNMGETTSNSI